MKWELGKIMLRGLDERLPPLRAASAVGQKPVRGWLRAVREALVLSQDEVAGKLQIKRQSYADIETAEERGAVSLNSLQRAAEAMDCDVVYFLVPRAGVAATFAELARRHDPDFRHLQATEHTMRLEGQGVGDLPREAP